MTYSRREDSIRSLKSELQNKNKLLVDLMSVASTQAKHISHIQSSALGASEIGSQAAISDTATTLPWSGVGSLCTAAAEYTQSEEPGLDAIPPGPGAMNTAVISVTGANTLEPLPLQLDTRWVDGGAGFQEPVHSSTPSRRSWAEVVCGSEKHPDWNDLHPSLILSNRFGPLGDMAPVHPVQANNYPD